MKKKKKDTISKLGFNISRPICSYHDCNNKCKRVGKRKYSDRCILHQRQYFAQSSLKDSEVEK